MEILCAKFGGKSFRFERDSIFSFLVGAAFRASDPVKRAWDLLPWHDPTIVRSSGRFPVLLGSLRERVGPLRLFSPTLSV